MKSDVVKEIKSFIFQIIIAVILAVVIIVFVGRIAVVDGSSMLPTLYDKDVLIIESLTQRFGSIKSGDIVVLKIPELLGGNKKYAIKRVIATEGQQVQISGGKVMVDGLNIDESYINGGKTIIENSIHDDITVPEGCVYVLGDNRLPGKSRDSRAYGPVKMDRIIGKSWLRIFPFNNLGAVK